MATSVRIEKVGKAYRLGVANRQALLSSLRSSLTGAEQDLFWALRDVSFEVEEGDVVGVMGHNGAGKSTLLKILSQITTPTTGRILLRGRVASLLEVGTGFHPELTGRENVFLNGTILGMRRREVAAKFDEVVAFAEVHDFIDTPVKRYSTGMRVRLAFAVAAHLEPEILIIDEVLAVGDAAFQQRCLGKIGDVAKSGRTVLFVSHNAAAIESLCNKGVVLEHGRMLFQGSQVEAIARYASGHEQMNVCLRDRTDRMGTGEVKIVGIELRDGAGQPIALGHCGQTVELHLQYEYHTERLFPRLNMRFSVSTNLGAPVFTQSNRLAGTLFEEMPRRGTFICRLPRLPLPAASYRVGFQLTTSYRHYETLDQILHAFDLQVENGDFFGSGQVPTLQAGVALVQAEWRVEG